MTAAPVQSSCTGRVRLACLPFVTWRLKMIEHSSTPENLHSLLADDAGMGLQMPFGDFAGE